MTIAARLAVLERSFRPKPEPTFEPVTIWNYQTHSCADLPLEELDGLGQFFDHFGGCGFVRMAIEWKQTARQLRDALFPDPAVFPTLRRIMGGYPHCHTLAQFEERAADALGVTVEQFRVDYANLLFLIRWYGRLHEHDEWFCLDCYEKEHGGPRYQWPDVVFERWHRFRDTGDQLWREQVQCFRGGVLERRDSRE